MPPKENRPSPAVRIVGESIDNFALPTFDLGPLRLLSFTCTASVRAGATLGPQVRQAVGLGFGPAEQLGFASGDDVSCHELAGLGVHVSPAAHSTRQAHRFEDGPV